MMKLCPKPVAVTGPAGMAAIFDCNLMHASGHNLSGEDRWQAYFCYNTVAYRPQDVASPGPDYVRSRNCTPLALAPADAIRQAALATAWPGGASGCEGVEPAPFRRRL